MPREISPPEKKEEKELVGHQNLRLAGLPPSVPPSAFSRRQ